MKISSRNAYHASVWREGKWFVAQCLEIDVVSQGRTAATALKNLREAVQLHLSEPRAEAMPVIHPMALDLEKAS